MAATHKARQGPWRATGRGVARLLLCPSLGPPLGGKHAPQPTDPLVQERILAIRDEPPEGVHRPPGPEAIVYYLPREHQLQGEAVPLPRSSRTISRIPELAWSHS